MGGMAILYSTFVFRQELRYLDVSHIHPYWHWHVCYTTCTIRPPNVSQHLAAYDLRFVQKVSIYDVRFEVAHQQSQI